MLTSKLKNNVIIECFNDNIQDIFQMLTFRALRRAAKALIMIGVRLGPGLDVDGPGRTSGSGTEPASAF